MILKKTSILSSKTGPVACFVEKNWKRSTSASKRLFIDFKPSTAPSDSRSAMCINGTPVLKRKCFVLNEGSQDTEAVTYPYQNATSTQQIEDVIPSLSSLEMSLTTDNRDRFNNGNLYAKVIKSIQAEYYIYIPSDLREVTKAVKARIGHLELEFPILGKLTFLRIITTDHSDVYHNLSDGKLNNKWIQFSRFKANVYILETEIPPKPHNRALTDICNQIDFESNKPGLFKK